MSEAIEMVDCAPPGVVCLDLDNSKRLAAYLRRTNDWMTEAWTRCGPEEP